MYNKSAQTCTWQLKGSASKHVHGIVRVRVFNDETIVNVRIMLQNFVFLSSDTLISFCSAESKSKLGTVCFFLREGFQEFALEGKLNTHWTYWTVQIFVTIR